MIEVTHARRSGGINVLRMLLVIVAMVVGFSALLLPVTAPTAAAAACWGTSCDGFDPDKTGCSTGARTLDTLPGDETASVRVELRYSPSCHAVWTRATNSLGESGIIKVIGYQNGVFAREELKTLAAYDGEVAWTRMISSSYLTYGCFRWFGTIWNEYCGRGF